MDIIKLGMFGLHLLASFIALAVILRSDYCVAKSLLTGKRSPAHDARYLRRIKRTTAGALQVLWLSGLALLAMQVWQQGHEVLLEPVLQGKFALVLLLTLNGWLLHWAVVPALERTGSLLRLSLPRCVLSVAAGTVASVSWWYACLLGMVSLAQWKLPLLQCLASFPMVVVLSMTAMLLMTSWAQARDASIWRGERLSA